MEEPEGYSPWGRRARLSGAPGQQQQLTDDVVLASDVLLHGESVTLAHLTRVFRPSLTLGRLTGFSAFLASNSVCLTWKACSGRFISSVHRGAG